MSSHSTPPRPSCEVFERALPSDEDGAVGVEPACPSEETIEPYPPLERDPLELDGGRSEGWSCLPHRRVLGNPLPPELVTRFDELRGEYFRIRRKPFPRVVTCAVPDPAVLRYLIDFAVDDRVGDIIDANEFLAAIRQRIVSPETAFVPRNPDELSNLLHWDWPEPEFQEFEARLERAKAAHAAGGRDPYYMDAVVEPYVRSSIRCRIRELLAGSESLAYQARKANLLADAAARDRAAQKARLDVVVRGDASTASPAEATGAKGESK